MFRVGEAGEASIAATLLLVTVIVRSQVLDPGPVTHRIYLLLRQAGCSDRTLWHVCLALRTFLAGISSMLVVTAIAMFLFEISVRHKLPDTSSHPSVLKPGQPSRDLWDWMLEGPPVMKCAGWSSLLGRLLCIAIEGVSKSCRESIAAARCAAHAKPQLHADVKEARQRLAESSWGCLSGHLVICYMTYNTHVIMYVVSIAITKPTFSSGVLSL